MGKVGTAIVLAAALFVGHANAQSSPSAPLTPAGAARARALKGDCAGALDAYDQALRTSIDPNLHRDRGRCHETLGHPHPAIDDYRAYLTARPDAPDADDVRARLQKLERDAGIVGPEAPADAKSGEKTDKSGVHVSVSLNATASTEGGGKKTLDAIENDERLDQQADDSPLRRGKGLVIGVGIGAAHFGKSELGWTETVGVDLRGSLSRISTLMLTIGYAHVNSTGSSSELGGAMLAAGYEARIALNPRVTDALLLGATLGYENLKQRATGLVYAAFLPQARLGYRHVFGPSLGLEAAFDGGIAFLSLTGAPAGADTSTTTALLGGHVALVVGF
jgi:hypothetical protein